MTNEDFTKWLKYGGRVVLLVEVFTSVPKFLSTVPYTTLPTDSTPNKVYLPVIAGGVAFSENLPFDGQAVLNAGDIEVHNEDAQLDHWLDEVWSNKSIKIYIGDITWKRDDFRLIFDGITAGLDSSSVSRLNISLRDKLQRLNTPVSELLLGGTTPNKDRLQPILLGECHNIEPLLVNPAEHEYQCHAGAMERFIEVRADGVPRSITPSLATGKFKLTAAPVGTITVSAQGVTPYANTVSGLIKVLATQYGNPTERFTSADIDSAQFSSFNTQHQQPVGIYINDRDNVLRCCQELAASVGAQVSMSRTGLLRLIKVQSVNSSTMDITPADYEAGSLSISQRSTVQAGVKLGYCKNWTVQTTLDSGIPSEHKSLHAQEWLTVTSRDSVVADAYGIYAEPPQEDTLLLEESSAQAEADRRLTLWKIQRNVYRFTAYANMLELELGQAVKLFSPRFGLGSGKVGQVVGLESDWVKRRVTVEVLI